MPNKPVPKVSIGMPLYNGELYLREALQSIQAQDFTDFELLISDNASTDLTPQICCECAERDARVIYIRQASNVGATTNFTAVLAAARGEYFMWAAGDDVWDRRFLSTLVNGMDRELGTFAFCPYIDLDEDGTILGKPKMADYRGRTILMQLYRFLVRYDDGCFYGLYRRDVIVQSYFPVWWSVNKGVAMNCAYPLLFFTLSIGKYVFCGDTPLWFNRVHDKHNYKAAPDSKGMLTNYLFYALRKVNVLYESMKNVSLGTKSFLVCLLVAPGLLARCLYDIVLPLLYKLLGLCRYRQAERDLKRRGEKRLQQL